MTDQLLASADTFGFAVNIKSNALGDANPFHNAGIPAASLMVHPDDALYYPQLHRPEDDPEIIQLEWLRTVGTLSAHALFAWGFGME